MKKTEWNGERGKERKKRTEIEIEIWRLIFCVKERGIKREGERQRERDRE